jgi:hypothetical protein
MLLIKSLSHTTNVVEGFGEAKPPPIHLFPTRPGGAAGSGGKQTVFGGLAALLASRFELIT